jgi:AraC family transcriptional activator of pobA
LGLKQFDAKSTDFYVNTIANHLNTSHLHINKPHKHDFYAAFLFTHGTGYHEIDFNSYEVKPNTVFLLSPGQTHNWSLSDDANGVIFFHSKEFYESHYIHGLLSDYPFFSNVQNQAVIYLANKNEEIVPIFTKLLHSNACRLIKKKDLLLSLVAQIYIQLENALDTTAFTDSNRHDNYYLNFLKFQQLVETHFLTEKSVQQYANRMNMTAKHLNRINRTIINKSTLEIIIDRVILEAKRHLIFGAKNISEIAEALGFSDYAHFSKIFKNKTGKTPSEFSKLYI